jgi:hypothetical protein
MIGRGPAQSFNQLAAVGSVNHQVFPGQRLNSVCERPEPVPIETSKELY